MYVKSRQNCPHCSFMFHVMVDSKTKPVRCVRCTSEFQPVFDDAALKKINEFFPDDEGENKGPVTRGLFERQIQLLLQQNKLLEQNQNHLRRISFAATLVIILIFLNLALFAIAIISGI